MINIPSAMIGAKIETMKTDSEIMPKNNYHKNTFSPYVSFETTYPQKLQQNSTGHGTNSRTSQTKVSYFDGNVCSTLQPLGNFSYAYLSGYTMNQFYYPVEEHVKEAIHNEREVDRGNREQEIVEDYGSHLWEELNCNFQMCVIMPNQANTRKIPRR